MEIIVIGNACPICGSDVKGNAKVQYLCNKCNVIFRKVHLVNPDNVKGHVGEKDEPKQYNVINVI